MEKHRFHLLLMVFMVFVLCFGFPAPNAMAANTYISDLPFVGTPVNGWGPVEKDMSNGEQAAGDGHTITLHGVTYTKGLGTHAHSMVTYNLSGQYSNFVSDIGIDDEVVSGGSVVFQVWVDGVKLFDSGIMTHESPTQHLNLDVTNKSQLQLVVNAGSTNNNGHADWAGAYLVPTSQSAGNGYYALPSWNQVLPASTRFIVLTDMSSAAVLDLETGLVWEQHPISLAQFSPWSYALTHCQSLTTGNRMGWRLPTLQELASLVDLSVSPPGPLLPSGHPFSNVYHDIYWSASTYISDSGQAWQVNFSNGALYHQGKGGDANVWCVRGGQGVNPQ